MKQSKQAEKLQKNLIRKYQRLEADIIKECASYIGAAGQITEPADWIIGRLYESGARMDRIRAAIQKESGLSKYKIDKIFKAAARDASLQNAELYTASGKQPIPLSENQQVQQLTRALATQTEAQFDNFLKTAGFMIRDAKTGKLKPLPLHEVFTDYLDGTALQIVYGFRDPGKAMNEVINQLTNSGLRTIDYASGRSDRIDTAVRRAVMTGTNQIVAQVQEQDAALLNTDHFEVEWHEGARPTHQVWQGKVYTKEQLRTVCGLGTAGGLCGVNCYHTYYPFVEGISKRLYTDEWLRKKNAEENAPKTYSGNGQAYTLYEAKQQMRYYELKMRVQDEKIEALEAGGATQQAIQAAKIKRQMYADSYEHFCWEMKLPEEWERVELRRPKKKKAP